MKQDMKYKGYSGSVEFSDADDCLYGRIIGINDIISYEGQSVSEIKQAFHDAVDDYLEDCKATGKNPDKPYSGKAAKVPPDMINSGEIIKTRRNVAMRNLFLVAIVILGLSGCGQKTVWYKPNLNVEEFNRDNATCQYEAKKNTRPMGAFDNPMLWGLQTGQQESELYRLCMQSKGYSIQKN